MFKLRPEWYLITYSKANENPLEHFCFKHYLCTHAHAYTHIYVHNYTHLYSRMQIKMLR